MLHQKTAVRWRVLDISIVVVAVLMVVYQLVNSVHMLFQPLKHANIHLGFALVIVFLSVLRDTKKRWPLLLGFAVLGVVVTGYVGVFFDQLAARALFNTPLDLVMGVLLLVLCLEATRRAFGWVLPALAAVFILYTFFGHFLPGSLKVMPMEPSQVVSRLSLALGSSGIYGNILDVSAQVIFLFMIFAAMITTTGAVGFFAEVGKIVGRRIRGGPALSAVVTSSLVGSVSGSTGANVVVTGSFTIPAMKKAGYTAEQAGAIEAAASSGGPIIPPVMGVTAFLLAGFTGLPYLTVIKTAALPAFLYMLSCAFYTYFQAGKMKISRWEEKVDHRELLLRSPIFVVPLTLIVVLFSQGYSPKYVSFWAVITVIVLGMVRKKTRPSLRSLVRGLADGAELGSKVAVCCATLGIMVTAVTVTGVGVKIPMAMAELVGVHVLLLLVMTGLVCLVLGMGLPASAGYILVATTIAPMLLGMGVGLLPAHMFVLFFTNFADITPPVAIAALFGSQVAGGNYMRTAIQSTKVGAAAFILPFMIIYAPAFTFDFSNAAFAVSSLLVAPVVFFGLQAALVGHFLRDLSRLERALLTLSPAFLLWFVYSQNYVWLACGLAILAGFSLWQVRTKGKTSRNLVEMPA